MEFKKFTSLENTYRQNLIDKVVYEGLDNQEWMVTEKIHGANFSFWCDGANVKVASRSQFVDGTFYGCQPVIDKYAKDVLSLWTTLDCTTLTVFGELYGEGIQKEVKYGEKDFRAFEVVVDGIFLNKEKARILLEASTGLKWSPHIFSGSFEDCLLVSNTFRSMLTPDDCQENNYAEGVVIEPAQPLWFKNGSRVYFKNKTDSFKEKKSVHKSVSTKELTIEQSSLLGDLLAFSTTSRVNNVISKVGQITNKDFGKILGLTLQDILEEYNKEHEVDVKKVLKDDWNAINKRLNQEVTKTVREVFVTHIE